MFHISAITFPTNWYLYRSVGWNISEVINENSLSAFNYLDDFSTFHANFCSFLISHELESTDISTPQQLPARGRHVYSFLSSAATRTARFWLVSFRERHHEHICWAEMFDRNQYTNFVWSCWWHTFPHCWDGMSNGSTFVHLHCWTNNVCQFGPSLTSTTSTQIESS